MLFTLKLYRRLILLRLRIGHAHVQPCLQVFHDFLDGPPDSFTCGKSAWFDEGSKVVLGSHLRTAGRVTIGDYFYCNRYSIINSHCEIKIGNRVQLGPFVYICDFDHDLVSQPHLAYHRPIAATAPVVIEDEVWIGAHAVVLKGTRIGKGSVVAAGAVVTKDVLPGSLVAGIPAAVIKIIPQPHSR